MINKFLCLSLILLSHTSVLFGGNDLERENNDPTMSEVLAECPAELTKLIYEFIGSSYYQTDECQISSLVLMSPRIKTTALFCTTLFCTTVIIGGLLGGTITQPGEFNNTLAIALSPPFTAFSMTCGFLAQWYFHKNQREIHSFVLNKSMNTSADYFMSNSLWLDWLLRKPPNEHFDLW